MSCSSDLQEMEVEDMPLDKGVIKELDARRPLRTAVFVRTKSPLYHLMGDGEEVVKRACTTLGGIEPQANHAKLLTILKLQRLTIFAFDLWNDKYDWTKAHYKVDIPVILVDFGKRYSSVRVGHPTFRDEVNDFVADQHDMHGWGSRPPYFVDQTSGVPTYGSPRRMKIVQPDGSVRRAVETPPPELGSS